MALTDIPLAAEPKPLPREVRCLLREANRRVARFQAEFHLPGFVPCDFEGAYRALHALAALDVAPHNLFCEWGSGFGVVACLAALLDFDACGIEIEAELVEASRRLAADFGLPVEFVQGSLIPPGGAASFGGDEYAWLTTCEGDGASDLGLTPADFGVIFCYPWPDEERLIEALFDRHAGPGALLLTCHGVASFCLRRKVE